MLVQRWFAPQIYSYVVLALTIAVAIDVVFATIESVSGRLIALVVWVALTTPAALVGFGVTIPDWLLWSQVGAAAMVTAVGVAVVWASPRSCGLVRSQIGGLAIGTSALSAIGGYGAGLCLRLIFG